MSGSTSTNALFNQWQVILAQGPAVWAQYGLYDPATGQWTQQGQAIRAAYSSGQQTQTPRDFQYDTWKGNLPGRGVYQPGMNFRSVDPGGTTTDPMEQQNVPPSSWPGLNRGV